MLAFIAAFSFSCINQNATQVPKYVFLFIGDGMGFSHIAATETYLASQGNSVPGSASLSFTQFPVTGMAATHSANSDITCSAAAGTALSTGVKTNNNMLGVDPAGNKLKSIAYDLKNKGYKIGIATSVSIDHATPGAFFANDTSRDNYYAIASQVVSSGFDFFAGSGFWEPRGKSENEEDVCLKIEQAGYVIIRTPEKLKQTLSTQKIVVMQEENREQRHLVQSISRTGDDGWTLVNFTRIGIERLYDSAGAGFFFMVEGGQIDWASHSNDLAAVIHEVIDFSEAIKEALEFYKNHPNETLIIITADHETGGLTPGQSGFSWTTNAHTGVEVPVFAIGAGSELFGGKIDNTDIPKKIKKLME